MKQRKFAAEQPRGRLRPTMRSASDEKYIAFVGFECGRFVRTSTLSTSTGPSPTLNVGDSCTPTRITRQLLPPRGRQAAGDDGEQEKNTEARQRKRVW